MASGSYAIDARPFGRGSTEMRRAGMPPLNMPPTYKDYERGRVLVAFNSTWESQATVPSVAEPEPTLLVEPAWRGAVRKSTSGIATPSIKF